MLDRCTSISFRCLEQRRGDDEEDGDVDKVTTRPRRVQNSFHLGDVKDARIAWFMMTLNNKTTCHAPAFSRRYNY